MIRRAAWLSVIAAAAVAACSGDDADVAGGHDAGTPDGAGGDGASSVADATTEGDASSSGDTASGGDASGGGDASPRDATSDTGADATDGAGDAAADAASGDASADAATCDAACNTPPAAACQDGNVVTYGAGACLGGSCVYTPVTQPCDYGCSQAACSTAPFSFLGGTDAFENGTVEIPLGLTSGGAVPTVAPTSTVTVIAEIAAPGTVKEVHLFFDTDPSFSYRVDIPMTFDRIVNGHDRYTTVLGAQPSGKQAYFYIQALPFAGGSAYVPGGTVKFTYRSQSQ